MQGNVKILGRSFTAAAAIAQFQPVTATGAAATAAGNAIGSADVAAATGDRFNATVMGTALMVAGGTIAAGALVEVHTTVTQVVTKSAGVAIGRYMGEAAAASGDIIEVLLIAN